MNQIDKKDKIRCKEFYGIPLTLASLLLFRDKTTFRTLLDSGSFFDSKNIKKKIYKSSGLLFIDRQFFFDLWEKLSHQELIISSHFFRKTLKVDKKTFDIIVDKTQRVKGLKGSYYKISYVNKVLKDNNLPELL